MTKMLRSGPRPHVPNMLIIDVEWAVMSYSTQSPIAQTRPQSGWGRHLAAKQPCHEVHVTTWLGWVMSESAAARLLVCCLASWSSNGIYIYIYIVYTAAAKHH